MNRYPPRHAGIDSGPPGFHHQQGGPPPNSYPSHGGQHHPPPPGFPQDQGLMGGGAPPPQFVPQVSQERFKLFVGKIAEMSDGWLNKLLEIVGPVLSVTRPAKPMAFVEYGDPEVVLRALEVLNGAAISYPSGKSDALLIKPDDKVRARLDEYEKARVNEDSQADLLEQAKNDLRVIADRIKKGESPSAARAPLDDPTDPDDDGIPAHLRDLAPEDLPEHHREAITSEIAMFREIAFKKAAEKKAAQLKREQEAVTNRILAERRSASNGRARSNSHPSVAAASSSASPADHSSTSAPGPTGAPKDDPQSYTKPVNFVGEGTGLDDAQKERERAERAYRDAEALFHDRERRYEQRERLRINNYDRERARERAEEEREARERDAMLDRLARWDDEAEVERGRESFYIDRSRWRTQRRAQRQREQEADELDRQREKEEYEAAAKQGDAFLDQLGLLAPPSGLDVKLKLEPSVIKAAIKPAKPAASLLGLADDDEEGKTKRALIPLVYDDEEGGAEDGKSSKESKEEIEARVPKSKDEVFAWPIYWSGLNEALITKELVPFTTSMIVESLGFEEEELLSAVMTHIRRHAAPQALIEELEPVLDEETSDFVVKFWRELILRTELSKKGGSK
ncbi:BQ2448_5353 [Microbotryum intermedium]|uniref:BQ2448_5353 protein n=1 Tax=Microbotryum intermedium TaxID=269621 RepID=A0A238F0R5_9BASI|nr:BQ2448_5353 [Microbotryum intermedium]